MAKQFLFYQDVKVSVWVRQPFCIEAESKEEAIKLAEQYKDIDVSRELICDSKYESDTEELMMPEDNGGYHTIEVYEADNDEYPIYMNAKL